MRTIATVNAYDVLSTVHVKLIVREYPDAESASPRTVLECTTTVQGTGETDPRQWIVDALVGLLEDI